MKIRISYSDYKNSTVGLRSVSGSYDKDTKTIECEVYPDRAFLPHLSMLSVSPEGLREKAIAQGQSDYTVEQAIEDQKKVAGVLAKRYGWTLAVSKTIAAQVGWQIK